MAERLADILRDAGALLADASATKDGEEDSLSAVHALLMQRLHGLTRTCPVISAENYTSFSGRLPSRYWLIKPPSTREGAVIQAALIRGGTPVRSAIYMLESNKLYIAEKNAGAFCNDVRLRVDHSRRVGEYIVVDKEGDPSASALERFSRWKCGGYTGRSGLAAQACALARGSADILYRDRRVHDWNIAASMLTVQEAGGHVTLLDGSPCLFTDNFRRPGILMCASEDIHRVCVATRKVVPAVRPAFRRFIREMAVMSATRRRKKRRSS